MASAKNILATYSPEDVIITIHNSRFSHIISGYSDSTFIELTRLVPHATLYNGADGTNARVVRAVRNYDITLTLHQASESNDVLSQLLLLDEISRDGRDIFAITLKDATGRTLYSSPSAFIGTDPDLQFGAEISDRAWVISAVYLERHIGGNGRLTPDGQEALTALGKEVDPKWGADNLLTP
jgi:hypothetical protein